MTIADCKFAGVVIHGGNLPWIFFIAYTSSLYVKLFSTISAQIPKLAVLRFIVMKISYTFYLIIISAVLFSCKKEVTELPPATQTGANTFGCKIDGKLWVPAGFGIVPTAAQLEARIAGPDLLINARNFSSSPTESEFEIFVKDITVHGVGNYTLNTSAFHPDYTNSYAYYVHRRVTPDNEWITTSTYNGTVTITKIDSVNHFVSGTFEFQAINLYNAPQPVNVTEGRFDVKIQ